MRPRTRSIVPAAELATTQVQAVTAQADSVKPASVPRPRSRERGGGSLQAHYHSEKKALASAGGAVAGASAGCSAGPLSMRGTTDARAASTVASTMVEKS